MRIAFNAKHLKAYLSEHGFSKECPVVISKFIVGAKEIDIDAVASNGQVVRMANESDTRLLPRVLHLGYLRARGKRWCSLG